MLYNTLLLCVIVEKRQMKKFYKKVDGPLNAYAKGQKWIGNVKRFQ